MTGQGSHAVFLSYASQDAEAARRICDALRRAAIEVWFDQSELRGGDAWDHRIRQQIRDCALFIPVISANSSWVLSISARICRTRCPNCLRKEVNLRLAPVESLS